MRERLRRRRVCDEFEVLGCTDPVACNFDPEATQDDMTCEYATDPYDCNGECLNDADGDEVCDEFEVEDALAKTRATLTPTRPTTMARAFTPATLATTALN